MCCVDVHLVGHDIARHAKVRDLQVLVVSHQDVTTGEVSMDYLKAGKVFLQIGTWSHGEATDIEGTSYSCALMKQYQYSYK